MEVLLCVSDYLELIVYVHHSIFGKIILFKIVLCLKKCRNYTIILLIIQNFPLSESIGILNLLINRKDTVIMNNLTSGATTALETRQDSNPQNTALGLR